MKKQVKTGAQRVAGSVKRYKDAGLIQAKVWVHPEEADSVRTYASKKPLTKAIRKELKR